MKRTILLVLGTALIATALPVWAGPYEGQRILQERQSTQRAAERTAAVASSEQAAAHGRELPDSRVIRRFRCGTSYLGIDTVCPG